MSPNIINIITTITNQNKEIYFEEKAHTYTIDKKLYTPVTTKIKIFQESFDTDTISFNYAVKHKLNQKDVKAEWKRISDEASELGTDVHAFGEYIYYCLEKEEEILLSPDSLYYNYKLQMINFWNYLFYNRSRFIPIFAECRVFSKTYKYAGTIDLILYDVVLGGIIIVDYKTNKDLYKNFAGKMLLSPFHYTLDTPFNLYSLQLSCYQIALEEIGLNVIDRLIVSISEEDFKILSVDNVSDNLKNAFQCQQTKN